MLELNLLSAFRLRESLALHQETEALRVFYGPGESSDPELSKIAIDLFLDHAWITQWKKLREGTLNLVIETLVQHYGEALQTVVLMDRSEVASEADVKCVSGGVRTGRFTVKEFGIPYLVQMEHTKHPGLFLDHAPLRRWLLRTQKDKRVLNLFSYTGSLSVAAAKGGATAVTTLDLSKPTIEWAKENWSNAGLNPEHGDFIFGDVFEWLLKMRKRQAEFDTILCDPPSFSRSKNGVFSTNKDSGRLHSEILPLLAKGGVLVTSINSENYSERNFLKDIESAAEKARCTLKVLGRVDLPESFPTTLDLSERYLKGFYLQRVD
jgi:23S rRNA (cytosine1962-C5)-methyltransferase